MSTRFAKVTSLSTALFLALSLTAVSAAPASACGSSEVALKTLTLSLSSAKGVYRIGDEAVLHARVTREVGDLGVSKPAEGATVFASAFIGQVVVAGGGVTDENGHATIRMKLRRYVPTGSATVFGKAFIRRAEAPCLEAREESEVLTLDGLFSTIGRRAR